MTPSLRRAGAGVGLVLLYVVAAVVTHRLQPDRFRPLFDGFAPPQPYKWVNPPPELAAGNQPPASAEHDVPLGPGGSEVSNVTPADGQATVQLEAGSVPANPPDAAVRLSVLPVDAGTLGPLPPGVKALSNAYRVVLAYQPSQAAVTQLAKAGTVALTASSVGDRLLFSADGAAWQEKASRAYGNTGGRFASLDAPGYYLVAGHSVAASGGQQAKKRTGPNPFLLVVVGVAPVVGAILVLRLPPAPLPARSGRTGTKTTRPSRRPAPKRAKKRP